MALLNVDFFSDTLGMCTQMNVILPERPNGKIPVVFLLHGFGGDHTSWCRYTSIERYAADRGLAVVMPTTHTGWYTDMAIGYDYFTYLTRELPEICRGFFPSLDLRRETTYAAGLSMGGYGAFKCAICAPEVFSAGISLSGGLDIAYWSQNEWKQYPNPLWEDVFGPLDQIPGGKDDLLVRAERLIQYGGPMPRLYAWCGQEDSVYDNNLRAWDKLKSLGVPLTTRVSRGDHSWKYWDDKIQDALDWLGYPEQEVL